MFFRKSQIGEKEQIEYEKYCKRIYSRIVEKFDELHWRAGEGGYTAYLDDGYEVKFHLWGNGCWALQVDIEQVAEGRDTSGLYNEIIQRKIERVLE